jgi:hypothetical protein
VHDAAHVIGVVVDVVADKDIAHQVELEDDLLEPQLICLVDDDKEHLVVALFEGRKTFGMLAIQDCIEFDVIGII